MKALVQNRYGSADVLRLADVEPPTPTRGQVRLRVHAAGVDRGVWHLMTGTPYLIRPMFGLRRPRQPVPGMDVAGTVDAVGPDVSGFSPGDEVVGVGTGTFAELAVAPAAKLAHRPEELDPVQAAALPISGLTALQAIRDHARVQPGDRVLVTGASGGVGSFTVQLAAAVGAQVTGVCRTDKIDFVRSLGATHVIDHTSADPLEVTAAYDVIVDIAGNATLRRLRRAMTGAGRLVIVGGDHGGPVLGGVDRSGRAKVVSPFVSQELIAFVSSERASEIAALVAKVLAGDLRVPVDRTYPLAAAADALRDLEAGRVRGKLVVTV